MAAVTLQHGPDRVNGDGCEAFGAIAPARGVLKDVVPFEKEHLIGRLLLLGLLPTGSSC